MSCISVPGEQSIRNYFKPIKVLPDSKGSLSATIPFAAIASANREVKKVMGSGKKKRRDFLISCPPRATSDTVFAKKISVQKDFHTVWSARKLFYTKVLLSKFFRRKFCWRKKPITVLSSAPSTQFAKLSRQLSSIVVAAGTRNISTSLHTQSEETVKQLSGMELSLLEGEPDGDRIVVTLYLLPCTSLPHIRGCTTTSL